MKTGAKDPHHRNLLANMSLDTVTSHMRHLMTKFRVFYDVPPQIGNLSIYGAYGTQSCAMIYRFEAPSDADLVHHVSFLHWSLNVRNRIK